VSFYHFTVMVRVSRVSRVRVRIRVRVRFSVSDMVGTGLHNVE